jgi:hypothetical protein
MLASEQLLIAECRTIEDGALEYHKAPAVTRSTIEVRCLTVAGHLAGSPFFEFQTLVHELHVAMIIS